MSIMEPWYWKILKPYFIYDEEEGEIIGVREDAPFEAKKAYEDDKKKADELAEQGIMIQHSRITKGRIWALKDKVVGYTDEVGVQIPPLHPRCRCAIMYREAPFNFDIQRFGSYEEQVANHGGSGKIKPDLVIEGHERTPSKTEPLSIIDHKDYKGAIDKRIYYDESGRPYFEINTTNHGNAKNHPYGTHGEHAHEINWLNGQAQRVTRELSVQERKDNGDIL